MIDPRTARSRRLWLLHGVLAGLVLPAAAAAAPGQSVRVDHQAADDAPALGPRTALVTIELFFTPGHPNAHMLYGRLLELQRHHPARVRVVFRPLDRKDNIPEIVVAAHRRGRFFPLMEALSGGSFVPSASATIELAVKVGLPRSVAERADLDDGVQAILEDNRHRWFRFGSTSNPELVVNGRLLGHRVHAGSITDKQLEEEYLTAYQEALRAEAEGVPPRALPVWGAQQEACGEPDIELDEPDDKRPGPAAGAPTPPPEDTGGFAWRLSRQLHRGTGCPVARHLPATLEELGRGPGPRRSSAPLLAQPLLTAGLPSIGPGDAAVVIQVVCNLRGRLCLDQLDRSRRLAEHYPGQVRVVWVPWVDLTRDGSELDLTLAQAALCATATGDTWGFIDAAISAGITGRMRIDVAAMAAAARIDADAVVACAAGEPRQARASVEAARAAGIGWGPTVVIGGRAYLGGFSSDSRAAERVAAELAPGLLESLAPSW